MYQILRTSVTINVKHPLKKSLKMTISLDLPLDLEHELSTEAALLKLPLSEYILRVLSVRPVLNHPPQTGAELVAYWQTTGVINSRPDIIDSQAHARQLRHEAETRSRVS
jgi:hypothetical protein